MRMIVEPTIICGRLAEGIKEERPPWFGRHGLSSPRGRVFTRPKGALILHGFVPRCPVLFEIL